MNFQNYFQNVFCIEVSKTILEPPKRKYIRNVLIYLFIFHEIFTKYIVKSFSIIKPIKFVLKRWPFDDFKPQRNIFHNLKPESNFFYDRRRK